MPRIAMLLSGCGNMDGSEIHESVSAIIAVDQKGWELVFTAPDIQQARTVSFLTGGKIPSRNVLEESARIARGRILELNQQLLDEVDAIVIPGGLGAALTLCDFALKGSSCNALPEVETFLKHAHKRRIPIAAMCIAPVLVARCIPGITVTIGTDPETARKILEMGCSHVNCPPERAVTDTNNMIVTTPGYMNASGPAQVLKGAISMVDSLEKLIPVK